MNCSKKLNISVEYTVHLKYIKVIPIIPEINVDTKVDITCSFFYLAIDKKSLTKLFFDITSDSHGYNNNDIFMPIP